MRSEKNSLVRKHGKKPTITYYYYLWNAVDYAGEEIVRSSFKSLSKQDAEVIVASYNTRDNTKALAKKYKLRFIEVHKGKETFPFPESKIRNAVIANATNNFLVPVNINVDYHQHITSSIKKWIRENDIKRHILKIRYKMQGSDGRTRLKNYGFSCVFYKPYLLYARGYDERTVYAGGSQKYGTKLMMNVFNLKPKGVDWGLVHKYHNDRKLPKMREMFGDGDVRYLRKRRTKLVNTILSNFDKGIRVGRKKVHNSYW